MVDALGGRTVHWVEQPGERPGVILLGGCGVPAVTWEPVRARLAGIWVAALDRPGLAGTAWPGRLPRLSEEVSTLADLAARGGGPVVVVGHSMAGPHAEALARQHPDLVAGVVLVDASVEWRPRRATSGRGWLWAARAVQAAGSAPDPGHILVRRLGRGVGRLLISAQSRRRGLRSRASDRATAIYGSPAAMASVVAENGAYRRQMHDLDRVRRSRPGFETPTRVLTAIGGSRSRWLLSQVRLSQLLGAQQVVTQDSRHLMMIDRPDLVVDAIQQLRARA